MKSDPPSVITIAMSRTFRLSPYLELNCMVLIARRALYVLVPSCKVSRSIVLILNSTNYYISCSRLYREILLVIKEHIEHYLSNLEKVLHDNTQNCDLHEIITFGYKRYGISTMKLL